MLMVLFQWCCFVTITHLSNVYHTTLFKVPQCPLQSTTLPPSKYLTIIFKVPHYPLQTTSLPSSMYHITLFNVPYYPFQSTTPPSSKYRNTLFKVPHHPLQSITLPSSKYHTTLFKVPILYTYQIEPRFLAMKVKNPIPERGLIYDYRFELKTGRWENWMDGQPAYRVAEGAPFHSITGKII